MKNWKKGLLAALCAVLALGAAIPAFGTSGTVYLMAVNDRVLDVTAENMPAVMGGVLYVPYTMLSTRDTGINLGVNAIYSSIKRTVLVSDGQRGVQFDLQSNSAKDLQGHSIPGVRAMVRNSMTFVPIDFLCSYFSAISYSRVRSKYGVVVRVTNRSAVLRDLDFADAAEGLLADSLRGYYASIAPPETAAPTPPPTAPSVPTAPPVVSQPSAPPVEAEVLLALRWGRQAGELARLLEERDERALFLFTADELREQDDAVRRLAAAGHTIGLALTGEDAGTCAAQLEEGRRLLAEIARYYTLVISAGALNGEDREALRQEGCAVWSPDIRGKDYDSGRSLAESLVPRSANRVELECGTGSTAFLRSMLEAMDAQSCTLRQATAPLL